MTPSWLKAHASYIDSSHSIASDQITFNKGSSSVILKVPLVPSGVLSDESPLTVEITVANNVSLDQSAADHGFNTRYGLSDRTNFVGFKTVEQVKYDKKAPCFGIEGSAGEELTGITRIDEKVHLAGNMSFPEQFVFSLKLERPRGWCFIAHEGGFTKTVDYSKRLKLSQGLIFEVYAGNKEERVSIKYVKVIIIKTDV